MSKQLNELTGKGALLAMGQTSVANFLSTNSQSDLAVKVGYFKKGKPNSGAVYNALKDLGWLPESKRSNGDTGGDKPAVKRTNGKRKGCLPARLDQSVNKALTGIIDSDDPAYIESPTWEQFKQARANQGENWITFIGNKLKTDKEKSEFELWITSNDAADKAESSASLAQEKALREAVALVRAAGLEVVTQDGCVW